MNEQQLNQLINQYDVEQGGIFAAVFLQRALERALRFRTSSGWLTDGRTLDVLVEALDAQIVLTEERDDHEALVIDLRDAIAYALIRATDETRPYFQIDVMGASRQAARQVIGRARELIPSAGELEPGRIPVMFWYSSCGSGNKVTRSVEAVAWADARTNYPPSTRAALEPLVREPNAVIERGRLLLWHGAPGTGKTSALRTLALENRASLALEYVLDPEAMFGREAGYFMNVIFDDGDDSSGGIRLLVLEDCDELLSFDAKERAGQGLSRLLNLVDGFIGQGLKIAVLITTNEPLSAFHPAVIRPGRCGAVVQFDLFGVDEAAAWLAAKGRREWPSGGRKSLAELISGVTRAPDVARPVVREKIGFVSPHELRR